MKIRKFVFSHNQLKSYTDNITGGLKYVPLKVYIGGVWRDYTDILEPDEEATFDDTITLGVGVFKIKINNTEFYEADLDGKS